MRMRKTLLIILLSFASGFCLAQYANESVVISSGGGSSSGGNYTQFAVAGEPFVQASSIASTTLARTGFIYRLDDLQSTLIQLTLYLEGLYAGGGIMNKARNASGDQYPGSIADKITLELHPAANYTQISYSDNQVNLNTDGTAELNVPSHISGSYYLAIKHRNSLETVSSVPLSLNGSILNYDFSDLASRAYGNNLKLLEPAYYGIYSGDVNNDGIIDTSDLISIQASASLFSTGYIQPDVNGDGKSDALDLILTDNNSALFVGKITP